MASKLSPEARRWRTIIVTVPLIAATSLVLYKRLVHGEPQRTLPRDDREHNNKRLIPLKSSDVPEHVRGEETPKPGLS